MSQDHRGNIQPGLDLEEHEPLLNAKRSSLVSASTIYAVVNTGAGGITTVYQGPGGQIANPWDVTLRGNVTLAPPTSFFHAMTSAASAQIVQFPNQATRWAIIQGDPLNSTRAFIGASGVSANVGFPLDPGQMTGSEISNLNQLWLANATGASVNVRIIGGS